MISTALNNEFLPISQSIQHTLKLLLDTLAEEYDALSQKNSEQISRLSNHKQQLSLEIEQLEQQRQSLLENAGVSDFSKWLNTRATGEISSTWDNIQSLLQQCAEQNQVNGIIVENNRRSVETFIGLLRGQSQSEEAYTRSGAMASKHYSAKITQA